MYETQTEKNTRVMASTVFTDPFGRMISRTSSITEESIALLSGRVRLCQTNDESLDAGDAVEIAVKSTIASPPVFISLNITAQMEKGKLEIFEDGNITGGGTLTCLNPNRMNQPSSNILE